jgi:polypeptide N-acetylgalactosaminyltransferase
LIIHFLIYSKLFFFIAFLGKDLDNYVKDLKIPTKVIRTGKRVGLIKARLIGAKKAQGTILTFLDAHCECTMGKFL